MTNQPSVPTNTPVRKVTFGAVSGALVTLIVGILNGYVPFFEKKPISGEISGAATTVVSFLVSYLVPPDPNETTTQDSQGNTTSARK
jgi:Na+/proline symporter